MNMKLIALFSTLLFLAAGDVSYAQMYMKAVSQKQGTVQPAVAAPSAVGNGFITVTAIDFGMTITLTDAAISDMKQSNSSDVISFTYTKETVVNTPPPTTPTVITPATTVKPVATQIKRS